MDFKIIKSPTAGTLDVIAKRTAPGAMTSVENTDAIGLVQGRMIDMICAIDIAEKAVGVKVLDVRGSCPQNMIMIAIFGDTSSVESAVETIKSALKNNK
ncbi:BMC domain-containing protein [Fusibacter sp. JL298sf-3]